MTGRSFRLATVLRVRRIQEEQARGEVARARQDVLAAEAEAQLRAERAAAGALLGPRTPAAYLADAAMRLARAGDAATARGAVAEVEALAEERHNDWRQAAARVKPLERLEEAHIDRVRAADDRIAQAANDEIAGARHDSNRRRAALGKGT